MLSVANRIEAAAQALSEGRIVQHLWRRENRWRESTLTAFGPDIDGPDECPAELMPRWLAYLVPASSDVGWFAGRMIDRARRWHVLDDAAWGRVRTGFQVAAIRQALVSAAEVQVDPARAARFTAAAAAAATALSADAAAAAVAAPARVRADTYRQLCQTLFDLIDEELPA